jgi:hypothetical protein
MALAFEAARRLPMSANLEMLLPSIRAAVRNACVAATREYIAEASFTKGDSPIEVIPAIHPRGFDRTDAALIVAMMTVLIAFLSVM